MGYLQMQLMNETTETSTIGICLNIDKFYADLDFTANSDFEKWDEYPFERFHERMREILEEMENKQQELPLLFSIPLDEEMSFLNITFCYNFIVMDKALFLHTQHEFEFDSEALEVCRNEDVDFCERILFLKDGKIFNEIFRGEKSRKDFFNEILDILTLLGGEVGNVR